MRCRDQHLELMQNDAVRDLSPLADTTIEDLALYFTPDR